MLTDACRSFGDDSDEYEDKEEHGLEKTDEEDIHQTVNAGARTGKAKAKAKAKERSCFSPSCELMRVNKSKFCRGHKATATVMRYHLMKAGKVAALNEVLNNVKKVDAAISEFTARLPYNRHLGRLISSKPDWGEVC